ncbi:MAG: hypothetical protein IJT12_10155 [Paludibacteraceae bacterium]|nr:hypothetical protein [Paludibacteraceae bacterium]
MSEDYEISSCPQLIERVQQLGFLPLLDSGIAGFCAEEMMAPDCHYVQFEDGSWEWPLWTWKGAAINEGNSVYGKFFAGKAGFISFKWWPDFYNWRRSKTPELEIGSIEEAIVLTLRERGSMIARELRAACGFIGPKMRGKFDAYINRLQMSCYIVTEDFVYPRDKHGREYGFGWSLLTTPENLYGIQACHTSHSPEESLELMSRHLHTVLPKATKRQIQRLLK